MPDRNGVPRWLHIDDPPITRETERQPMQIEAVGQDAVVFMHGAGWTASKRHADGSDADRVGAWPERGTVDIQLGPNRNGRKG